MSLENGLQVAPNHGAGAASDSDATTQELPHHVAQQQPPRKTWLEWLRDDVHVNHTDLPLFACCFISGLCDSVTVNASNVFVSMQTGNTIFLALGAASLPYGDPYRWLRSLVSIGSFALGCFTFAHTRHFQPKRKATLALSFLVQAAAIWIAAILAQTGVVADYNRRNRSAAGTTTVLWIAGFIKVVIAACWLAWPSKTLEPKSEK
ncbi:Serine/threonine-protein kinase crk1 [Verticillium dahliae VDG1]|nr:Serine/threonine-protein kinase crk1 [Verticillium dahliae VDG1]